MSEYYTPRRTRGLYDPASKSPFKLSRSKIDLFIECPRCFFLDRRLGVARPPGFPFALNSAVDKLLKKEFDIHRAESSQHPLMKKYGIDAVPVAHDKLDEWRENFVGIQYHYQPANFIVTGAIDDLWQNPKGEYIVVDYKATSKEGEITKLDKAWQDGYKRQMEVYQWLLRMLGFSVSKTGYFVYCNGRTDRAAFDAKIEFDITVIPHTEGSPWVEPTLVAIKACLNAEVAPQPGAQCDFCAYRKAVAEVTRVKR